jgi:hypothetical protein
MCRDTVQKSGTSCNVLNSVRPKLAGRLPNLPPFLQQISFLRHGPDPLSSLLARPVSLLAPGGRLGVVDGVTSSSSPSKSKLDMSAAALKGIEMSVGRNVIFRNVFN